MPTPAQEQEAASVTTFILAALAVLAAYGHLLMISISYIKLVLIPVIMLAFIGAVAYEFCYSNSSGGWQLMKVSGFANRDTVEFVVVPQLVQLLCSGLDNYFVGLGQQQNDRFLISHFLFFFSSSIGALRVMMMRVANKVSQVLQMTFTVVLNMALHAKVTEWVGEDMALVCLPELIAALLWFFGHFDHGGYTKCIIDNVLSFESGEIIFGAAVTLLSMFAYERNVMFRVLVSCTLSGMLSHFSMRMISGTQENDSAKVPVQLLKYSANVCFGISAIWAFVLAILHLRLDVSNLVETVTSFIDVEVSQMSVLAVFGCLMLWISFLFVDLGNQIEGGAPSSSTSSRPLLSSIRLERGHRAMSWLMFISIFSCYLTGKLAVHLQNRLQ